MLLEPRNYRHIKSIYHIPCTHKRHPITHSQEWVNTVLFIGDSFENNDHVGKKLVITIRFVRFSLSWMHCYYTAISSAESRDVCLSIPVRHTYIHTYICIYQIMGIILWKFILDLRLIAKQFEYYHTSCFNEVVGGLLVSPCPFVRPSICPSVFNNTRRIHFIFTHLIEQLQMCHVFFQN